METDTSQNSSPDISQKRTRKKLIKWGRRILTIAILGLVGWALWGPKEKAVEYVTETVSTKDVHHIVDISGSTESGSTIGLRFERGGKISNVLVGEGDEVKKGDILTLLEENQLNIDVEQAEAALNMAQAELDLKYAGPNREERAVSEVKKEQSQLELKHAAEELQDTKQLGKQRIEKGEREVKNAEITLENAKIAYENAVRSGGKTEESAQKGLSDDLISAQKTIISALDEVRNAIAITDDILEFDTTSYSDRRRFIGFRNEDAVRRAKDAYRQSKTGLLGIEGDFEEIIPNWNTETSTALLEQMDVLLITAKTMLDETFVALENSITGESLSETVLQTLRGTVKTGQDSLSSELETVRNREQIISGSVLDKDTADVSKSKEIDTAKANVDTAQSALEIAMQSLENIKTENSVNVASAQRTIGTKKVALLSTEKQHEQLIAEPRSVDVASLQANVNQKLSAWKRARANLEETILRAPRDGIVTDVAFETGESITTAEDMITIKTDGLYILANVPETDILPVNVGDPVEIDFDAFPSGEKLMGEVFHVDPAETIIQGVVYYQIKVSLTNPDERVRSGMTADLEILAEEKKEALTIPVEALQYEGEQAFVSVLENGEKIRKNIRTGLEGEEAIEVLEGLNEGERVILYEKTDG
ncbi:efflux RND transporter periplasmic adaptor subunit [Candidatus Peregrinibacteria bacterium]|nr:MAG: efflux RND transporter periplasmic adaptor subunit [Candidatus Peregrinibacteria bacterium]